MRKLILLVAGAFFLLSPAANAVIVYSGSQNLTLPVNGMYPPETINIAGDAVQDWDDLLLEVWYTSGAMMMLIGGGEFSQFNALTETYDGCLARPAGAFGMTMEFFGTRFSLGQEIGAASEYALGTETTSFRQYNAPGAVPPYYMGEFDQPGYMGLRMAAVGGGYNYAWLHVAEVSGFDTPSPTVRIDGWAYETDVGASIEAGAIPEPATVALLGMAGAALAVFRRRRS